jgi:hypothetical protein
LRLGLLLGFSLLISRDPGSFLLPESLSRYTMEITV